MARTPDHNLDAQVDAGQDLSAAETFGIAELARDFDVTARTIRFYESHGLLEPVRQGQTRVYSKQDRAKLAWILRGKRVGFSLNEIRDMLDLYDADDNRMTQRAVTLSKCRERICDLQSQRSDIDATIQELQGYIAALEAMVSGQDQSPDQCSGQKAGPWNTAPDGSDSQEKTA